MKKSEKVVDDPSSKAYTALMEMFASSFPTETAARDAAKRADLTVRRCAFTKMVTAFLGKTPFAYLAADEDGNLYWTRCGTELLDGWTLV